MMACRVVAVALGALLALIHVAGLEAKSQVVHLPSTRSPSFGSTFSSSSQGGSSVSTSSHNLFAHSELILENGTVIGECSYLDREGKYVKVKYTENPDGQIQIESNPALEIPNEILQECRTQSKAAAESAAKNAQETFRKIQEQTYKMQQQLQEQIARQNQEFQKMFSNSYFPSFPKYFPFNY